jgi:hypothetical protein
MSAAAAIRRAMPILAEYGHVAPFVLRAWLIRGGLTRADAAAAARFIPLALGRAILLEGLGLALPDSYLLVHGDAREERKLAGEPFFAETMKLAPSLGPAAAQVALLSPEVQAVNAALNAGSRAEDLVASLPVVQWEAGVDDAPAKPRWKFWA